ncbi:MAG: hypothetical protein WEB57_07020 [Pseudohongiellaceae bacterium]
MTTMIMVMCLVAAMALMFVQRQQHVIIAEQFEGMGVTGFQMAVLRLVEPVRVSKRHHRLGQHHNGQQSGQATSEAA